MSEQQQLSQAEIVQMNDMASFFSFKYVPINKWFFSIPHKIICSFTGNQFGKTAMMTYSVVLSMMGRHPVVEKNLDYYKCACGEMWNHPKVPKDGKCAKCGGTITLFSNSVRTIRFASETLPGDSGDEKGQLSTETKNTLYPELKRWLPPFLIKKDITQRSPKMVIKSVLGGPDIVVEFVSYGQSVQSTAGSQRFIIACVAEGQRVLMADGVWRPIEEIREGDEIISEALGGHGDTQRTNRVKMALDRGVRNVFRYNCERGLSFEVTEDHKIMVPGRGKRGYCEAKDLKIGDRVYQKYNHIDGMKRMEDWQLVLLAVLIGDGCLTQKSPTFYSADKKFAETVESYLPPGMKFSHSHSNKRSAQMYDIVKMDPHAYRNPATEYLRSLGVWGKYAHEKSIPDVVFQQDLRSIALFLRFLYATDGWASGGQIGFASTSKRLVQDIHFLLRRFDIGATISYRKPKGNWRAQWCVMISKAANVLRFVENIGIESKDEAVERARVIAEKRGAGRKHNMVACSKSIHPTDRFIRKNAKVKSIEVVGERRVFDLVMETEIPTRKKNKRGVVVDTTDSRSPRNNFVIQGGVVVHNCDEEPPYPFWSEQLPRLLAADGWVMLALTPANYISWTYSELFERASAYYRSETIAKRFGLKKVEIVKEDNAIAVIQAATDDNATLRPDVVERLFESYDDEDVVAIRRYGIFKQVSGRIFKDFSKIHIIEEQEYFPEGINPEWFHARGCDYHGRNPWAIGWAALSDNDEMFVYDEMAPSPEKFTTDAIARAVAENSGDYRYKLNLVDPLIKSANGKDSPRPEWSVLDDFNGAFSRLRQAGVGTGGLWEVWDTKSERGRDAVKVRLKNSIICGKPFNNIQYKEGARVVLPTIWFFSKCKNFTNSLRGWAYSEWSNTGMNHSKEAKDAPEQKNSHFCMVLEGLLKDARFRPAGGRKLQGHREFRDDKYFRGARA